ncbi:hypothetical protein KR054_007324 [Drosophila jambulina]|nr:hypothetical protein KR054_007324 [Drosophila jambulina]
MSSESNGGTAAGAGAGAGGGGGAPQAAPPQYIITTPSEVDADEFGSLGELQMELGSPETQLMQSQKFASSSTTKVATRSYSMTSSSSSGLSAMQQMQQQQVQMQQMQQLQQQQQQQHQITQQQQIKQTQQIQQSQKIISSSTRSQSLQSSSILGGEVTLTGGSNQLLASASAALAQQLKAQSSTSIITSSEQRTSTSTSTSTSSTRYLASGSSSATQQAPAVGNNNNNSSTSTAAPGGKSRFQSFLQQPEGAHGFLTAHQKHVRQFVRSTSAHSEAAAGVPGSSRPEKCIRSASTQIDDAAVEAGSLQDSSSTGGSMNLSMSKLGLQQSSSILISKSAETIEMKSSSAGMRTQLTLSGGFLAPPGNRKITILSPIHAPPGLHEMLRRAQGRSPLSPRISFPGSDTDLFG